MAPKAIEYINAEWYYSAPFLSEFLLRFKYVQTPDIPTMAVGYNKCLVLYYNEDFLNALTELQLKGVLVHEIMHIIYMHTVRFDHTYKVEESSLISEHQKIYNYAADTAINERILTDLTINGNRIELPANTWNLKHPLLAEYKGPLITEKIYLYLLEKIPKVNIKLLHPGESQDGVSKEDDETSVTVFDEHGMLGELDSQDAKEQIELIKYTAAVKGWGKMDGGLVGHIRELLAPQKVPLQKILRKYLQLLADGYLVKFDTYSRMNRRNIDMLPGRKKKGATINLCVDTSGSCFSEEDQMLFYTEIDYLANKVRDINLIQIDTKIQAHTKYKKGVWRSIKLKGSGGTEFQPLFDYLKAKKLNAYPTIIFTDGYFDWNMNHYNIEPLWVVNNDNQKPTFGHLFILNTNQK